MLLPRNEKKYFLSETLSSIKEEEKAFIYRLLYKIDTSLKINDLQLVSNNEDYDTYKFHDGENYFCLKVSLDPECDSINHESIYIRNINQLIRPEYYKDGFIKIGSDIRYLLLSYEDAEPIFEFGMSYFLQNFPNFLEAYAIMQDSEKINSSYEEFINKKYLPSIDDYFLSDESLSSFQSNENYEIIKNIYDKLYYSIVNFDFKLLDSDKNNICHNNLNQQSIISREGFFKFINFDKCVNANCLIDFFEILLEFGIPKTSEKQLFSLFKEKLNIKNSPEEEFLYKKIYFFILSKKFIDLILECSIEKYLYKFARKDKLTKRLASFNNSFDRYSELLFFKKNSKEILNYFSTIFS
jgi:hypothetical protein